MFDKKYILVTGGSGFIGLHIVNEALKAGYKVNTTTRSLQSEAATPLKGLLNLYPEQLSIFEADLLQPNAYHEAIQGVDTVLHVATPVLFGQVNDNPDLQIKPAVEGTENILQSCLQSDSVKTIIITSSGLAIMDFTKPSHYVFTEQDISPHDGPGNEPYIRSKILAERLIWKFYHQYQNRFRMVTIHPTLVFGPNFEVAGVESKNNRTNAGQKLLLNILNQTDKDIIKGTFNAVDVRDVAIAHIKAIGCTEATGRIIIFGQSISKLEIIHQLHELIPHHPCITPDLLALPIPEYINRFDHAKSQQILDLEYRPFKLSLQDSIIQLQSSNKLP